tara:strand:- start:159 stop:386 length:228 start_codon:yes stop_codon:yes gene_type:complete
MSDYQTVSFRQFVESEETELARVWKENLNFQEMQQEMQADIDSLENEVNDLRRELEAKRGKTLCPSCEKGIFDDE